MFFNTNSKNLLLNDFPCDGYAFSLQKINKNTTFVIQVQRTSDNTLRNFTAIEITNGTLANWVGVGNNGFVRIWYDQSGNNRNLIIKGLFNQIVANGVVLLDGGEPYINYTGNSITSNYSFSPNFQLNATNGSVFCTYNSNDANAGIILCSGNSSGSTYIGAMQNFSNSSPSEASGTPIYHVNTFLISPQTRDRLFDLAVINTDVLISVLNINFSLTNNWLSFTKAPFVYINTNYSQSLKAKEIIVYNSNQTPNKASIEINIQERYNNL